MDPLSIQQLKNERDYLGRKREEQEVKYMALEAKYNGLLQQFQNQTVLLHDKQSQAAAEISRKQFENERLNILLSNVEGQLKESENANASLRAEIEALKKRLDVHEVDRAMQVGSLNMELKEKTVKLAVYERMETAIDQAVVDAANNGEPSGTKITELFPTAANRRMMQALQQTMRANMLEKELREKNAEILKLYDERESLRTENRSLKGLMNEPVSKLIEAVTVKTTEIGGLKAKLQQLEKEAACQLNLPEGNNNKVGNAMKDQPQPGPSKLIHLSKSCSDQKRTPYWKTASIASSSKKSPAHQQSPSRPFTQIHRSQKSMTSSVEALDGSLECPDEPDSMSTSFIMPKKPSILQTASREESSFGIGSEDAVPISLGSSSSRAENVPSVSASPSPHSFRNRRRVEGLTPKACSTPTNSTRSRESVLPPKFGYIKGKSSAGQPAALHLSKVKPYKSHSSV